MIAISPDLSRSSPRARRAGFTLAELLIATTIMGFVIAGIMSVFVSIQRGYDQVTQAATLTRQFRILQEQMALDFRNAVTVVTSNTNTVTLDVRFYNDGSAATRRVKYALSNGSLVRTEDGKNTNLVSDLGEITFTYYQRSLSGTATTTTAAAAVNAISVVLTPNLKSGGLSMPIDGFQTSTFQLRRITFP